jgi:hypothetical protein
MLINLIQVKKYEILFFFFYLERLGRCVIEGVFFCLVSFQNFFKEIKIPRKVLYLDVLKKI